MKKLNIFVSHPSDMLTDCLPHGDGLMANSFIRHLSARGHTLHVAVGGHHIREPYASNVNLHYLQDRPVPGGVLSRSSFALSARAKFRSLSKAIPFDLIHQLNPVVTGLSLALAGLRCPLVMGPYVPDWPETQRNKLAGSALDRRLVLKAKRALWRQQHRMASAIILSTPAALGKVSHVHEVGRKIHFIPYGVDTSVFTPGRFPSDPTILFVANVSEHKGILVLLEAFSRVSARFPTCKLLVAGEGKDMKIVKQIVLTSSFKDKVSLLGVVSREKLPEIMRQASVFVLPSFGEPFGVAALEAMASGLPVVVTQAGGLPYFVSEKGGRKVPVGNSQLLADALIEILSDRAFARTMGFYNRSAIEQWCSWERVIEQLEAVYRTVMLSKRQSLSNTPCSSEQSTSDSWFSQNHPDGRELAQLGPWRKDFRKTNIGGPNA